MSFKKRALSALAASIFLGGIFSAPSHATGTTVNLTIDCVVNTTARDQYVNDGYTLVYTIKNCVGAAMNWPAGTTYSLNNGSTVLSSGTVVSGFGPTFGVLSASITYTLTIVLPTPIPASFVANSMHSSTQTGGKSGTNGQPANGFGQGVNPVIYFVTDPALTAGTTAPAAPTSAPSLTATARPQITADATNITCTSGSWLYQSAGATTASSKLSSISYSLLANGVKVATVAPTTVTDSQTFAIATLDKTATYVCDVNAVVSGTPGEAFSNGDISVAAKLAADLNTAKNAARDAYFATIAKINSGHSATLDALSAVKGTGADRVAARAALFAKIQADTKAAKAKAAADRTAAIAAATKAYAKALTATKTAVILSSN
jgi:hypothetical protein